MSNHTLVLNIRIFWRSSQMFNGMMGSNKSPNQSRYVRLIALSASQIILGIPVAIFNFYVNAHILTVHPWISWDDTHSGYSFVGQIPSFMWRANPVLQTISELNNRWIVVISAFCFFTFFGFAEEARRHYHKAYSFASSSLHLPDFGKSGRGGSTGPAPYTPSSSFGQGFKFSAFKNSFSSLGTVASRNKSETTITAERKDSFLVSEYRLTSSDSIFEGVGNSSKALAISPGDDDSQLAPAPAATVSRSALEALAAVTNFPAPPPPIARVSVRSLPPGLYPHSPTLFDLYLDPSETV